MFNFLNNTAYTFEGKKEEEEVVLFLHRHWFTLANKITALTALALLPFIILVLFGQLILAHQLIPLFTFLWSSYIMMLWFFLFYSLTMFTLDYWVVTNERIVDSKQMGFFNRRISELSIHMIQDISVKLVGFVPTLMNFGNVEVQTAAEQRNFLFHQIPEPQVAKDKIMEIIEKTEDELGPRMHGMVQRHHYHPDKYVIQRISEGTKDKLPLANDETVGSEQASTPSDSEPYEEEVVEKNKEDWNNVPPNLPL